MTTVNYGWTLPTVGASVNAWGTLVNTILTDIDAKMFARTGGAISGNVSVTGLVTTTGDITTSGNGGNGPMSISVTNTGSAASDSVRMFADNGSKSGTNADAYFLARTNNVLWSAGIDHSDSDSWKLDLGTTPGSNTILRASSTGLAVTGIVTPEADNTRTLGTGALRWSTVYAGTGTINTSDAREKTKVRTLADAEVEAAKALSKEIGIFQWLDAVAKKGDKARQHVGFTVQRAIEIMKAHGLDPMAYAFICHDVWGDEFVEHPAIPAVEAKAAVLDDEGNEIEPAVESVEGKDAWTEQTQFAGDRYAFRYDQLNLFIARGIEARLTALEARA